MKEQFVMTSFIHVLCVLKFVSLLITKEVLIVFMAPEMIMSAIMVNLKVVVTPAIIEIIIVINRYFNRLLTLFLNHKCK